MPERTDWSELDNTLTRLLQEPSYASKIVTATADVLDGDPFLTVNAMTMDYAAKIAAHQVTDGLPDVVAVEALAAATRALPLAYPGETCGEYAIRLRAVAKALR
jgi:hypothetical protein